MKPLLITLCLINTLFSYSQEEKATSELTFGIIAHESNIWCNFKDLNRQFERYGIQKFDNSVNIISYGFYLANKSSASYTSVQFGLNQFSNNGDTGIYSSSLKALELVMLFNYNLLKHNSKRLLYPKIGFGFSNYMLTIAERNYNKNSFPQILDSLAGEKTLVSNSILSTDLGIGYERQFILFKNTFFIGANLSYVLNFNKPKWTSPNGNSIFEVPLIKTGGPKISIVIRGEISSSKNLQKIRNKRVKNR